MSTKKWEYFHIVVDSEAVLDVCLEDKGREGWELVNFHPDGGMWRLIFKRPFSEAQPEPELPSIQ